VRIEEHPILEFEKGPIVEFQLDGRRLEGHEGESIAAALQATGVSVLRHSIRFGRPRGFFCAIGRCSSCLMTVDGVPNVMTCITPLREGMRIETQRGKGEFPRVEFRPAPEDPDYPRDLGTVPLAIVGAGPAGLSAAAEAGRLGIECVVIDENRVPGGQLIKQTHMFFGSLEHHARVRGIDIGDILLDEIAALPVTVMTNTTVVGLYPGKVMALLRDGTAHRLTAESIILATGASENMLAFPNSDLPGVYGAGAVQTLMNVDGVAPGKRVLMVGAGNIGLIVSYQLLQAGVEVAAVIEGMPEVGGYHVHAAKIRRAGVPILTSHTILRAIGSERVEGAVIAEVKPDWSPIEGTERELAVDTICLAVGLTPNGGLASQLGCGEAFVAELGGRVPVHGADLSTTIPGVFVAGDASGIEEASTAMLEGRLAGLAAGRLTADTDAKSIERLRSEVEQSLRALRGGPFGRHARTGKEKMVELMRGSGGGS
jgi:sarcosine oxidase subunit alpha